MVTQVYPYGVREGALVAIKEDGIYPYGTLLPKHLAWLTPDAAAALVLANDFAHEMGGEIILSDCYRNKLMQWQAHMDYLAFWHRVPAMNVMRNKHPELEGYEPRPKRAFSPEEGPHQSGRAVDAVLDPAHTKMSAEKVRLCFVRAGWHPIAPVTATEGWHHEFRGRFQAVYDDNLGLGWQEAYRAMVRAMIADIAA